MILPQAVGVEKTIELRNIGDVNAEIIEIEFFGEMEEKEVFQIGKSITTTNLGSYFGYCEEPNRFGNCTSHQNSINDVTVDFLSGWDKNKGTFDYFKTTSEKGLITNKWVGYQYQSIQQLGLFDKNRPIVSSADTSYGVSPYSSIDNNLGQYYSTINSNNHLIIENTAPIDIEKILLWDFNHKFKSGINIIFYDSNGVEINRLEFDKELFIKKYKDHPVNDVKKIIIENISNEPFLLSEIDFL
jgi:hypothetical protein